MFELTFDDTKVGKDDSSFKLDRLSPSMVGLYLTCPLAFYYAYIAKIQIPQTRLHLLFGTAVHAAIEELYTHPDKAYEKFKETFKKEELDLEGQQKFSEYYMLGLEMIKNYIESHTLLQDIYNLQDGTSEFAFREKVVNPLTGEKSRIPISGRLDRILANDIIVEYKTSKTKWNADETRFKVQSLLYNLWFFTKHNHLARKTLYLILLKKYKQTKRDEVLQIIESNPTLEDLAGAWEEVDSIIDKIESGMFERPTSGHPRYCDCYKYERLLGIKNNN